METFEIESDLTYKELLLASFYTISQMKQMRRIFIFLCIVGLINGILNTFASPKPKPFYMIIFSILIVPLSLILSISILGMIILGLLFLFKPKLFRNNSYRYTNWGIEKVGDGINNSTPWNKFIGYKETRNFIFIYLQQNVAHIVQKRKLKSKEELSEFLNFIAARFSN